MEPTSPPITTPEQLQAAFAKDVRGHILRDKTVRQVGCDPLPGPSARAFAGEPIIIHGQTLRPVVGGDIMVLKQIDSPLIRRTKQLIEHKRQLALNEIPEGTAPPASNYTDAELAEMVFQFTRPFTEVRDLLAKGVAHFRSTAALAIKESLPQIMLSQLVAAVEINYQLSFATFLGYEPRKKDETKSVTLFNIACGATDGFGWFTNYYCHLRIKCGVGEQELIEELPLARGFTLIAWSTENNGLVEVTRAGRGYVGQEVDDRLAAEAAAPADSK